MTFVSKRIRVGSSATGPVTPFDVVYLTSEIMGYISPGNYLFCATVCKTWAESWRESCRDTITDVSRGESSVSQIRECIELGTETVTTPMMETVAKSGDFELLKRMSCRKEGLISDGQVLTAAVRSGNFDMVKWLFYHQDCSTAWHPLDPAARRGDIEMYKWLRENGATRTWLTASKAATMGHLDMLKVIHVEDCDDEFGRGLCQSEYDEAMMSAIYNKQVHVMDWLVEVGMGM